MEASAAAEHAAGTAQAHEQTEALKNVTPCDVLRNDDDQVPEKAPVVRSRANSQASARKSGSSDRDDNFLYVNPEELRQLEREGGGPSGQPSSPLILVVDSIFFNMMTIESLLAQNGLQCGQILQGTAAVTEVEQAVTRGGAFYRLILIDKDLQGELDATQTAK